MNTGKEDFTKIETQQARAIQLLFAFFNHSPYIAQDYNSNNGNKLLAKVLLSSKSVVGFHTLKVSDRYV